MRPTDVCHPNDLRAPAPRVFPAHLRHFRGGDTPRSLRLRTVGPGDRMVHAIRRTLRRIFISCFALLLRGRMDRWSRSVGVFFPRHGCDRTSDTPVANSLFTLAPLLPSQELPFVRMTITWFVRVGECGGAETIVDAVP
jgi:hypothetical protein